MSAQSGGERLALPPFHDLVEITLKRSGEFRDAGRRGWHLLICRFVLQGFFFVCHVWVSYVSTRRGGGRLVEVLCNVERILQMRSRSFVVLVRLINRRAQPQIRRVIGDRAQVHSVPKRFAQARLRTFAAVFFRVVLDAVCELVTREGSVAKIGGSQR